MLALERFGLITRIQDALHQKIPLGQAIQQAASASIEPLSPRTLEDWWYAYKKGGFAALHPKGRSDRDQSHKRTSEQTKTHRGISLIFSPHPFDGVLPTMETNRPLFPQPLPGANP